jgi:LysM repeat protein
MILKRALVFFIHIGFFVSIASAQSNGQFTRQNYIDSYKDLAIKEMLRSGVPASITLAQGMLESENGNSSLAKKANNHFGIKCHKSWKGPTIYQDDDRQGECFRKYKSVYDSYQDHSDFLMSGSRYGFLFELKTTDYRGWAKGLKKAGYATSPTYAEMLIKIIEENELSQFDLKGSESAAKQKAKKASQQKSAIEPAGREILVRNRVKFIIVKADDTFRSLQDEFDLLPFEIYKYNDLARDGNIKAGDVIYLQPKRNRAEAGKQWHTVKAGETMEQISQIYAVKPAKLYSRNLMLPGTELKAGDKISLRRQIRGIKPKVERKREEKPSSEDEDEGDLRFEFDK